MNDPAGKDPGSRRRFPPAILAILAAALAAGALHLALFWPGIMVWDAIRQYGQALSGQYDDWHPPAMNWLWRQLLALGSGPAPMLMLQASLYWGGLALLAAAAWREGRPRLAPAIAAIALMPIAIVLVGTILKDSLMAGTLLVATGLIGWSRTTPRPWPRIAAAALLLAAATLRFNAMPACLPLAFVLLPPRWRENRARQIGAILLIVAALLAAMPLANRLLRAKKSDVQLSLVIYDLAGITRYSGSNAFPPLGLADPVAINAHCYSAVDWDAYAWWGPDPCPIQFAAIRDHFRDAGRSPNLYWAGQVMHHPLAYAAHRLGHFDQDVRFIVDEHRLHPLSLKTDPNPWGFAVAPNRARGALAALAGASLWTPLGWPLAWMALALATLLLAPSASGLARPLAWSALLYGFSYLPLSVATEVRYHFWTTTAAAVAAATALAYRGDARPSRLRWVAATAPFALVVVVGTIARLV